MPKTGKEEGDASQKEELTVYGYGGLESLRTLFSKPQLFVESWQKLCYGKQFAFIGFYWFGVNRKKVHSLSNEIKQKWDNLREVTGVLCGKGLCRNDHMKECVSRRS
jgi:hypothetical protein